MSKNKKLLCLLLMVAALFTAVTPASAQCADTFATDMANCSSEFSEWWASMALIACKATATANYEYCQRYGVLFV